MATKKSLQPHAWQATGSESSHSPADGSAEVLPLHLSKRLTWCQGLALLCHLRVLHCDVMTG